MKVQAYHHGRHLSAEEVISAPERCIFCGSRERRIIAVIQRAPDITLNKCLNCHAASASHLPRPEVLDKYYGGYYASNRKMVTIGSPERFATHIFKDAKTWLQPKKAVQILDFGGGNGRIAYELAKLWIASGFGEAVISVCDYNDRLVPSEDSRIRLRHLANLPEAGSCRFDLIIASAVLEHLPDPGAAIRKLFELLPLNGVFYARTPYNAPFLKLFGKLGIHFDFTYPAHLHDLGLEFWNQMLAKLNFGDDFRHLRSRPSIVESSFSENFVRTLISHLFKWPHFILGNHYHFGGGWEVFIRRRKLPHLGTT